MAIDADPRSHVTSDVDFYSLLSIKQDFTGPELDSAFRKVSIKYHPDKTITSDLSDKEKQARRDKWDLLVIARKVLENAELRRTYDQIGAARKLKQERDAKRDAERQQMIEKLEAGEKKARTVSLFEKQYGRKPSEQDLIEFNLDPEEKEKLEKMRAENTRIIQKFTKKRQAAAEAQKKRLYDAKSFSKKSGAIPDDFDLQQQSGITEATDKANSQLEMSSSGHIIRVRYLETTDKEISLDKLELLFTPYGCIDSAMHGKTKRRRLFANELKKSMVCSSYIQFSDKASAVKAVGAWRATHDAGLPFGADDWTNRLHVSMVKEPGNGGESLPQVEKSLPSSSTEESSSSSSSPHNVEKAPKVKRRNDFQNSEDFQNYAFYKMRERAIADGNTPPPPSSSDTIPKFSSYKGGPF